MVLAASLGRVAGQGVGAGEADMGQCRERRKTTLEYSNFGDAISRARGALERAVPAGPYVCDGIAREDNQTRA